MTPLTLAGLKALLKSPFTPTPGESAFISSVIQEPSKLDEASNVTQFQTSASRLFKSAFSPPVPVAFNYKYLRNSQLLTGFRFHAEVQTGEMIRYQKWYFEKMVPKVNGVADLTVPMGTPDGPADKPPLKPILPLLLYGTVDTKGTVPKLAVSFKEDSILTGGAQNESRDTTLCQIRTGIVRADGIKKFNIPIHTLKEITPI